MLVMIEEIEKKIVVDVTRESLMCGSLQPTPFFFFSFLQSHVETSASVPSFNLSLADLSAFLALPVKFY